MEDIVQQAYRLLKSCSLCPRHCGVNRVDDTGGTGGKGYCGQSGLLKVAYVGVHRGEEPPITGTKGSGTVFFTGCSLRCSYCQNYQISHRGIGQEFSVLELAEKLVRLIVCHGVHNINFVTPDHFFPHMLDVILRIRQRLQIPPVVMNCSGYQDVDTLKLGNDLIDIYLPDFKYADAKLAKRLSTCSNYAQVALGALDVMLRQKGYLQTHGTPPIATKGVLVRHLILPGYVDNSCEALTMLFVEFGPRLPISIMSQYYPVRPQDDPDLNRTVTLEEFEKVLGHAKDLGFETIYVQCPKRLDPESPDRKRFIPDFSCERPFD